MNENIYLSGEYFGKNPTYHIEDSPWKAQQIIKMINKQNLLVRSVCEIGCGAGEILRQMQIYLPRETTFHGYEISPQAIALCLQRENDHLKYYGEDLLCKDTSPFDLLLCIDVFEHVEDYMGFVKKIRQKAIYKIFHIPLDISVQTVLRCRPIVSTRKKFGHLHYFMKETALLTLEDAGYNIIDYFYTPAALDNRAATLKTKIAKVPRRMLSFISIDLASRILGGYSLLVLAK